MLALLLSLMTEGVPMISAPDPACLSQIDTTILGFVGPAWGVFAVVSFYLSMLILNTNVIFYNFYAHLLRSYSATLLMFFGFTTPIFTAIFGYFLQCEQLSWPFYATLVMTSYGLYLFYRDELIQREQIQKEHGPP